MRKSKLRKINRKLRKRYNQVCQDLESFKQKDSSLLTANDQISDQLRRCQLTLDDTRMQFQACMDDKLHLQKQVEAHGKWAALGLIPKYQIRKADGTDVDPGAKYFVLRYDQGAEPHHRAACRASLSIYAQYIKAAMPHLSSDIEKELVNTEPRQDVTEPQL